MNIRRLDHLVLTITHLNPSTSPSKPAPSTRNGALGPMVSVYIRDPDGNLVEVSQYR